MIRPNYPPEFERLWTVYPKKQAKKAALKAFCDKRITAEDVDMLIPIVIAHAKMWAKEDRQLKYTPSLGPWLRGDRWEDETCTVNKLDQCHEPGCVKKGEHYEGWKRFCDTHKTVNV